MLFAVCDARVVVAVCDVRVVVAVCDARVDRCLFFGVGAGSSIVCCSRLGTRVFVYIVIRQDRKFRLQVEHDCIIKSQITIAAGQSQGQVKEF